jgi:hypothetical protein
MQLVKITLVLGLALLTACSPPASGGTDSDGFDFDESPAAAFDLELVQMAIVAECEVEPVLFDQETCDQIDAEQLTADDTTLRVSTSLDPSDTDRAGAICEQIAEMRFSGEDNEDVGFETVAILDTAGATAAECESAH